MGSEVKNMRRGRYAPTPSGQLHLGNARTALLAWLQMRHAGGEFILRIEDVDRTRCRAEYTELLLEDLRWLGMDWDEGPDLGGPHEPYIQSECEPLYQDALAKLTALGRVYPCYCSRADIRALARAPHGLSSEGPSYPGTCRELSKEDRRIKAEQKVPSIRLIVPKQGPVSFLDGFFGEQRFPAGTGGDFVLKRADGMYGYQLAVILDDARMGITDVLRGSDLLDSTPRQLWLYDALGLTPPAFTHVPLVLGPDGSKLSKRHGSIAMHSLRRNGVHPESIVGWLAYLSGLIPSPEPVHPLELVPLFSLAKLSTDPVILPDSLLRSWTARTPRSHSS